MYVCSCSRFLYNSLLYGSHNHQALLTCHQWRQAARALASVVSQQQPGAWLTVSPYNRLASHLHGAHPDTPAQPAHHCKIVMPFWSLWSLSVVSLCLIPVRLSICVSRMVYELSWELLLRASQGYLKRKGLTEYLQSKENKMEGETSFCTKLKLQI